MNVSAIQQGARFIGIELGREEARGLADFWQLVAEENRRINLTSVVEESEVIAKHLVDSLSVLLVAGFLQRARVVDVGAGAGFPGIPLAIVRRDWDVTLIEATAKKARFLERAAAQLGLRVTVVQVRAEAAGHRPEWRERFDLATARALAPLPVACEWCLPLVRVGGVFVAMRGPKGAEELEGAQRAMAVLGGKLRELRPLELPGGAGTRVLGVIEKVAPTPAKYPRPGGEARKRPLGEGDSGGAGKRRKG